MAKLSGGIYLCSSRSRLLLPGVLEGNIIQECRYQDTKIYVSFHHYLLGNMFSITIKVEVFDPLKLICIFIDKKNLKSPLEVFLLLFN